MLSVYCAPFWYHLVTKLILSSKDIIGGTVFGTRFLVNSCQGRSALTILVPRRYQVGTNSCTMFGIVCGTTVLAFNATFGQRLYVGPITRFGITLVPLRYQVGTDSSRIPYSLKSAPRFGRYRVWSALIRSVRSTHCPTVLYWTT